MIGLNKYRLLTYCKFLYFPTWYLTITFLEFNKLDQDYGVLFVLLLLDFEKVIV